MHFLGFKSFEFFVLFPALLACTLTSWVAVNSINAGVDSSLYVQR